MGKDEKKRSAHIDFNFPPQEGTGIPKLIPHASEDCIELIVKLLAYNPDDRLSARQALRHPYFKELRDAEKRQKAMLTPEMPGMLSTDERKEKESRRYSTSRQESVVDQETSLGLEPPLPTTTRHSEPGPTGLPSINPSHHAEAPHAHPPAHHNTTTSGDEGPNTSHHTNDGEEEGSLPPIGNLSLSKANMSLNQQTARRGGLHNFYKGMPKNKGPTGATTKRQPGPAKYATAGQGMPAAPPLPHSNANYKYK
eukprot:gene12593-15818_t